MKVYDHFEIGHSLTQSHTFIPQVIKDPAHDYVWVDIAGLNDSGGLLMCLVNGFLAKRLFDLVGQVKFLMPITLEQITEIRGQMLREHIQTI